MMNNECRMTNKRISVFNSTFVTRHSSFGILLTLIFFTITSTIAANAEKSSISICPLCSNQGELICPLGFEAACQNETPGDTEPKCILLEKKYMPGCWKFVGIKKMDINFDSLKMPPSTMIKIIGGGETYTLNRETIGCRKL